MFEGLLKQFLPLLKRMSKEQLRTTLHKVIDSKIDEIYDKVKKL